MRNTLKIMLLVAFATFAFTSCNKENTPAIQEDTVLDITMDYANFSGNDTKGTKKNWENGDLVYLVFGKSVPGIDYKNYVKMQFNGTKWVVANKPEGQTVLNNLPVGDGVVYACHHTGITDPSLNTDETRNVFPNNNKASFALMTNQPKEYTKTTGKITTTIKFDLINDFQFNIKGLEFVENKYKLNIYDGPKSIVYGIFDHFIAETRGMSISSSKTSEVPAQKGIDTKEISFYVLIDHNLFDDSKKRKIGSYVYAYTFNPTFELVITIKGKSYYAQRTITGDKEYSEHKAYSLKGPNKTDAEIETAADGADLGEGWKKVIK